MSVREAGRLLFALLVGALALPFVGCSAPPPAWSWQLPPGFPEPPVPLDNPMSQAKVDLGRSLFYDTRLSDNQTMSCGTCHLQSLAFTDGKETPLGSTGAAIRRNTPSLTNIAYVPRLTWAHHMLDTLEAQALMPMFGEEPIELGLRSAEQLEGRLGEDRVLSRRFRLAFPGEPEPLTAVNVTKALGAFQRSLISGNSSYDRYLAGDPAALGPSELRGMTLFFSEQLECFHCHGGFNFTDSVDHAGLQEPERAFHNTALYNLDGHGAYPARDTGLFELTGRPEDMGRFRAPTLRNIALTAPYMHDGSIATLEGVLAHYETGGRVIEEGVDAGAGTDSPLKDEFMQGFILTAEQRTDVIAFLRSLTDEAFLVDPRHAPPADGP